MAGERRDLTTRLDAHLEQRRRYARELERLSSEAQRLAEVEEMPAWWVTAARPVEPVSDTRRRPGVGPISLTVVIPVHNAPEELRACLISLARHSTYPATVLIIDDASTDPRVEDILAMAAMLGGVRVLRNVENLGFTHTVNRAIRTTSSDIVLLNSDTAVGPRWLEQLVGAAYSAPEIGTVTPVSNHAGAFSVPIPDRVNPLPLHLGLPDVARLMSAEGSRALVESPTGNGFCLYIKRALIDAVGEFDALSFPRGYGEENDFCMRALQAGWRNVIDARTFVQHHREASFGESKRALSLAGRAKLDELHPDYGTRVKEFLASSALGSVRTTAQAVLERAPAAVRPRVLFVIHQGGGGAIATNLDLMRAIEAEFDCFVFSSDRFTLRLERLEHGALRTQEEWQLERQLLFRDFSRPDYRAAFAESLDRVRPELVHIRHVFKHTLDAPRMAADRAIPVVMSIHDHYTICPTIHLIDDRGKYCGGPCSPGHGTCPTLKGGGGLPPLKHAFVFQWRDEMEPVLRSADAFVTTSRFTRDVHQRMLPAMSDVRFEVIEHGRDLKQHAGLSDPPVPGGKVRVLIPGNLDRHKGAELIKAMSELDLENRLELHFLGEFASRWGDLGVMHGAYTRESFIERLSEIRPTFIGLFSVTAETYNHALTEAWAAGIPVLATDIGALGERVRSHGGGFLIAPDDPAAALRAVFEAADDPDRYRQETALATLEGIPTVADMAARYSALYRDVLDRRRVVAAPPTPDEPLSRGVWRMSAAIRGRYPSAYVRVLQRYHHPEVEWKLRTKAGFDPMALVRDEPDLVLVQRNAVPTELVSSFVAALAHKGLPLVLDLDDHLMSSAFADAEQFASEAESVRVLLDAAALVTVSSAALAETVGALCQRVVVVPNQLDERLFLADNDGLPPGPSDERDDARVHLVYQGSPSHAEDLQFLRQVIAQLAQTHPDRFELEVVGGEPVASGQEWYRRLQVPREHQAYPNYVSLLRAWRRGWDIAVAPLLDTPFNRHKSDLKFLEYTGLGLPGVYSDLDPYATVRHEVTGLLVGQDVEQWCEAIVRLAADDELRASIRGAAWNEVTDTRLLRHAAPGLLALLGTVRKAERHDLEASLPEDGGVLASTTLAGKEETDGN